MPRPTPAITPGSPAFQRTLLSAMEADPRLQSLGPIQRLTVEQVSRNTIIYRYRAGSTRLVAKAQLTKPRSVVVAEYRMLQDMERRLSGSRVRGLKPIALFPDLGVLLTEEEGGVSLREILEAACDDPDAGWDEAESALEAAAAALRTFHDAYASNGPDQPSAVRCYLDFSPRNLLIQREPGDTRRDRVVLMDPPEEEVWGSRTEDIGGFCFDVTRIGFLPRFLFKWSVRGRLDRFKARFIAGYYKAWGEEVTPVLEQVKDAECRRAVQALRWYSKPWRYSSMAKETARLCYLGPLTAAHRFGSVHRSYSNVRRLLGKGPLEWERP